ncbi:c-di-GMP-binding flagellar brake protein YcgR, contains PilZNR and PilZ domains [Halobacillus dabanensis]|uniref:C-di-GMP-binding flagellar brake protein YcgR, contains PilZNR and PilZ domains n=1 Tax=Halobacillus dabanensis TaxID=240302 RepID=A0A1I3W0S1_HALDA|nr:flagellar brake domain-containing protein [Halobacillus dabanensis]SFK01032.1 c-di-GMP-binding flagellar brake protein YcgR, contains PilZNR and PilZ domains [Halobacillus dabanensis]
MQNLKVGTPLTLELHKPEEEESHRYKCKLVDYDLNNIYIDYPIHMETGRTGFFLEGTQFHASFVGRDQSVYWFKTKVVARKKMNIPVIALPFPGMDELRRIQRRKYVRVEASVDVAVEGEHAAFPTVTQDISGGGLMILQPAGDLLIQGEIIQLTVVVPMNSGDTHYREMTGKVIRTIEANETQPARVSVEFIEIPEKDRQLIIRYCFEQQMQSRMKALN